MAAESYGEAYAPNAACFHRGNEELALASVPGMISINLASGILANGITDPYEMSLSEVQGPDLPAPHPGLLQI